jgi:hypothetical protein
MTTPLDASVPAAFNAFRTGNFRFPPPLNFRTPIIAMKSKFLLSMPLVGCLAFVSCYPLPDKQTGATPPKNDQTVTSADQQKIQEQRDRMKETEEKKTELTTTDAPKEKPEGAAISPPPEKPVEKRGDYAFANPVPGKEGFVFSPYNQKLVDVRDIPSGTLVQDPTYPASEKKYFRVP